MADIAVNSDKDTPDPQRLVYNLTALLNISKVAEDAFECPAQKARRERMFGGQVIAQAMLAACRTTEGKSVHSLHAYFMRAGDESLPIRFSVARDFDGRSFATRRVVAIQDDKPILNLAASFQRPEEGLQHQVDMPDVPAPEDLLTEAEYLAKHVPDAPEHMVRWANRPRAIELRPIAPRMSRVRTKTEPRQAVWMRAIAPLNESADMHRAFLAFASDMGLMSTSLMPHGLDWATHNLQGASLDHALWFHEDYRADEWMLYVMESDWTGHGRGHNRGKIFSHDGTLVASTAQEALIRLREK